MPTGVIIEAVSILLGGTLGAIFKSHVPTRIKEPLNTVFGISAITIGIVSLTKINSLPAVILAIILGCLIGELINLDAHIKNIFSRAIHKMHFKIDGDYDEYMNLYIIVSIIFCASGTNIFGALTEGITGDMTILVSKAVLDVFASFIFATTLGYAMHLLVIPQFISLCAFFYLARLIMPLTTPAMISDFMAVGGILTIVIGLCITKILKFNGASLLPALILVFPSTYLLGLFF